MLVHIGQTGHPMDEVGLRGGKGQGERDVPPSCHVFCESPLKGGETCVWVPAWAEQSHSFSPAPTLSPTPALLLQRKSGT